MLLLVRASVQVVVLMFALTAFMVSLTLALSTRSRRPRLRVPRVLHF